MSLSLLKAFLFAGVMAFTLALAALAHADDLKLRANIVADGPSITLGDLFENAGAMASRGVAPAPGSGRSVSLAPRFVESAVRAAGLSWTAPGELTDIQVQGPGSAPASARSETAVRRGDLVTLVFATQSIQLATRVKAQSDAAVGDVARFLNPASGKIVEAIVTGPGAARAMTTP